MNIHRGLRLFVCTCAVFIVALSTAGTLVGDSSKTAKEDLKK